MNEYMSLAIEQARIGISNGEGGPFGAVIVRDGKVVGKGHNQVLYHADPTCHGEMQAIRDACRVLGTYDLSGCELYTTGEPCPMCLAACMWANIERIYYGCTIADNEAIGFRDKRFFDMLGGREGIPAGYLRCIDRDECRELFAEYAARKNIIY